MSKESGLDMDLSFPFTHVANNRRSSVSDLFSLIGYTILGALSGLKSGTTAFGSRDSMPMSTVFALISMLHVFGHIHNINERLKSNVMNTPTL